MFECPNCGKKNITIWGKLCLGPLNPATCSYCNKKISVYYKHVLLSLLPIFMCVVIRQEVNSSIFKFFISIIGIILSGFINIKYVPLVKESNYN